MKGVLFLLMLLSFASYGQKSKSVRKPVKVSLYNDYQKSKAALKKFVNDLNKNVLPEKKIVDGGDLSWSDTLDRNGNTITLVSYKDEDGKLVTTAKMPEDHEGKGKYEMVFANNDGPNFVPEIDYTVNEWTYSYPLAYRSGKFVLMPELHGGKGHKCYMIKTEIETDVDSAPKVATAVEPEEKIYDYVEQMPAPEYNLDTYIKEHLKYPKEVEQKLVAGQVVVSFVVNKDGKADDVSVIHFLGYGCDYEAVQLVKSMPAWKPGKQGGKTVKVRYTMPIPFKK